MLQIWAYLSFQRAGQCSITIRNVSSWSLPFQCGAPNQAHLQKTWGTCSEVRVLFIYANLHVSPALGPTFVLSDDCHCSHLLIFYPFTCRKTLNMSQKQNSTAEVQSAFPKSIYAQVLSITGMASTWINSVFEPGPPGNIASQKQGTPCAPSWRECAHM